MAGQTEQILNAVLEDIEAGRMKPGDVLEEAPLMTAHGVSRTPVREAFIQLETAGLIRRLPRKGAVLFKPTLEEFLAIIEVHAMLEGQAAGLAARRISPQQAEELERAVKACEAHAQDGGDHDPSGYYRLNMRFHEAVAQAAGNPFLVQMVTSNGRKLMAYYRARFRYPEAIGSSVRDHREIATLIVDRKCGEAEAAMASHVAFDHVTVMDLLAALV